MASTSRRPILEARAVPLNLGNAATSPPAATARGTSAGSILQPSAPAFARKAGEFARRSNDPANVFLGLSGDPHFGKKLPAQHPTVTGRGFGYHVSAPMYQNVTRYYNSAMKQE